MNTIRSWVLLLFIAGYLMNFFVKIPFLPEARAALAILFFSCSLFLLKPVNRWMCALLFSGGAGLLLTHEVAAGIWVRAMIENSGLISLLLTVPLLGLILRFGAYEAAITALASRYIRSEFGYYAAVVTIANLLGTFLSMAAVPLCYQMMKNIASNYDASLTAKALARGFCANLLWSPNLIAVAVALQYIRLPWYEVAPVGISLSAVVFLLTLVLERRSLTMSSRAGATGSPDIFSAEHRKLLALLGGQIVFVLVVVLALDYAIGKNVLAAVSLTAFCIPGLIAATTGKLDIFRNGVKNYFTCTLPAMANEFMLFSCVGFFGYSLGATDFGRDWLARLLGFIAPYPQIAPFLIIWTIGLLAIVGVHPIITISSLGVCLTKISIGLSDIQLAISLMMGYILYSLISPFSSMAMMLSGLLQKNVFEVSVRINLGYAFLISIVLTLLLHFVG